MTEEEKTVLDEKLRLLLETGGEGMITYFLPDERKDGGAYVAKLGTIKKIDPLEGRVILTDRTAIPIKDILEIEIRTILGAGM